MKTEWARFAVRLDDGSTSILSYITVGRGSTLPDGATWKDKSAGWWERPVLEGLVFGEVVRAFPAQSDAGQKLPQPLGWRRVDDREIPGDRTYRDALSDDGRALSHDMVKAREIHRTMLRHARAPLLAQLDVDAMMADESRDARRKAEVVAEKNRLRDLTAHPSIEAAQTVEALKAVTLGVL